MQRCRQCSRHWGARLCKDRWRREIAALAGRTCAEDVTPRASRGLKSLCMQVQGCRQCSRLLGARACRAGLQVETPAPAGRAQACKQVAAKLSCADATTCLRAGAALQAVQQALGGQSLQGWTAGGDYCTGWQGVTCGAGNHVTSL